MSQQTGAVATPGVTGGAGSPPAAGVNAGAGAPNSQPAGAAQGAGPTSNQQVGSAGAAGGAVTQTVPYDRFREVNAQNRQLQAYNQQLQQQLAAARVHSGGPGSRVEGQGPNPGTIEGVAPEDQRILMALDRINERRMQPIMQRLEQLGQFAQSQQQAAQIAQGRELRGQIEAQHPIFKDAAFGESASLTLQAKLAEYQSMNIPVNPIEVAEEVAVHWATKKAQYDAALTTGLVNGARTSAAAGRGAGAAVTQGGASGPMQTAVNKPRNAAEAGVLYRESLKQPRGVGQA